MTDPNTQKRFAWLIAGIVGSGGVAWAGWTTNQIIALRADVSTLAGQTEIVTKIGHRVEIVEDEQNKRTNRIAVAEVQIQAVIGQLQAMATRLEGMADNFMGRFDKLEAKIDRYQERP